MQIKYEDREYSFEVEKITVDEWRELKRKYKMTPKGFTDGLDEADPDAMTFAYWVMLRQNGQQTFPLGDALKPDIIALNNAFGEWAQAEKARAEAEEAEPDPTKGSLSTPTSPGPPSPAAPVPAAGGSLTA